MRIPLSFYEQLRSQIQVSDVVRTKVALTRKGREYSGLCPFHQEKTPSFTVNDAKRFYHCFGCSAHGDVIRFTSEISGISYKEAAIQLAKENGIELPTISPQQEKLYEEADHIYNILQLAAEFFITQMPLNINNYLEEREIDKNLIEEFSIGYAPGESKLLEFFAEKSIPAEDLIKSGLVGKKEDGKIYEIFNRRIMFPIKNVYNKVVGFGGRVVGNGLPKYINSPETIVFRKSEVMYGEHIATASTYKKNQSIVVEGYMDVIALHKAGFKETFASLGTAVTEKHLQKLWQTGNEIVTCLDGDAAGIRASNRLINLALPNITADKSISFIRLPEGSDPDDVIKSGGSKLFSKILAQKIGLSEMIWFTEYQGKNFKSAEAKARLEKRLEEYCRKLNDKTLVVNFRRYFKNQIWTNLVQKKNNNFKAIATTTKIPVSKNYTEEEIVENAIFVFLLKFPDLIKNHEIRDFFSTIEFKQNILNDFCTWFLENLADKTSLSVEIIASEVKNTRFYDNFLLLSKSESTFLDTIFIKKNIDNSALIFEWLRKKHYLISLKREYTDVLNKGRKDAQLKASIYLDEIQKTSKELSKLNEFFVS